MAPDVHRNMAASVVATAPSPATSGTSLVVTAGEGARFPTGSFDVVICPAGVQPSWAAGAATGGNFEMCRATISTDTLTLTRAQYGTTARTVVVGDQVFVPVAAKTLTDVEALLPFYARLQWDSTTAISLQRFNGNQVSINGESVDPGSGGISCATTDNLLSSTGTDSGGAMGSSTLYYLYVSNPSASFAPSDLRASATAPSLVNGVRYLGTSGNALHWRFVGYARTTSGTQFADSLTQRLLINAYNQRGLPLETCPGYVDNDTYTSFTLATNSVYAALNGGTGSRVEFVSDGLTPVTLGMNLYMACNGTEVLNAGIGVDSTTSPARAIRMGGASTMIRMLGGLGAFPNSLSEGYHTADLIGKAESATVTIYADMSRDGAAADPKVTVLIGQVMG